MPSSSPSPSGPPRWRQVLSIAWNVPPTLKIAICLPPASTHFPVPGGTSPTAATRTKFAMARLLARAPGSVKTRARPRRRGWPRAGAATPAPPAPRRAGVALRSGPSRDLRERRDVGDGRDAAEEERFPFEQRGERTEVLRHPLLDLGKHLLGEAPRRQTSSHVAEQHAADERPQRHGRHLVDRVRERRGA